MVALVGGGGAETPHVDSKKPSSPASRWMLDAAEETDAGRLAEAEAMASRSTLRRSALTSFPTAAM